MKLIQVTAVDGVKVTINTDHIVSMSSNGQGTHIVLSVDTYHIVCKDDLSTIIREIQNASHI